MKTHHKYNFIWINDIFSVYDSTRTKLFFCSEKKGTDFSDQSSQHVSSVVGAYWNPGLGTCKIINICLRNIQHCASQ